MTVQKNIRKRRSVTVYEKTLGLSLRVQIGGSFISSITHCSKFVGVEPDFGGETEAPSGWALYNSGYGFIWVEKVPKKESDPDYATLVHEITHIVDHFLNHIGEQGGETRARLTEFLYREVKMKLSKNRK